jgi:hypothetical protein
LLLATDLFELEFGVIIAILLNDVDRVNRNLTGFVEDLVNEPTAIPRGNRSLLFRDPDGNLVNFFTPSPQPPSRSTPADNSVARMLPRPGTPDDPKVPGERAGHRRPTRPTRRVSRDDMSCPRPHASRASQKPLRIGQPFPNKRLACSGLLPK